MKKVIYFFAGLSILALISASLLVSVRLYEASTAARIRPVMFQPEPFWQNRIAEPVPLEQFSDAFVRDRLMARFVVEYLRVSPDTEELAARGGVRGLMRLIAHPDVFREWRRDVMPGLHEMAARNQMRRVVVPIDDDVPFPKRGDYYVVPFIFETWNTSNDPNAGPIRTNGGEMFLKIRFERGVREMHGGRAFNAGRAMDRGFPAPAVFRFTVEEAVIR